MKNLSVWLLILYEISLFHKNKIVSMKQLKFDFIDEISMKIFGFQCQLCVH